MKQAEHCGLRFSGQLLDTVLDGFVEPAVAARFLHSHVEPDGRIEGRLLMQHQVGQFVAEVLAIRRRREVAVLHAPVGDGIDNAMHQFRHAALPLGRAQFAVEVLAGDDVGGGLRPVAGHFNIALLENHRAFVVADGGGAGFPLTSS